MTLGAIVVLITMGCSTLPGPRSAAPAGTPSPPASSPISSPTPLATQSIIPLADCPLSNPAPPSETAPPVSGIQSSWRWIRNEALLIVLDPPGRAFSSDDGTWDRKFMTWRLIPGDVEISGQRLDALAQPALGSIPDGYGDQGFQATSVIFPTTGCWEVTYSVVDKDGKLRGQTLEFVVSVPGD
ncbi:MAG: hypothetical protein WKF56_04360 [Candidatus Limnocylindrales bacterium]